MCMHKCKSLDGGIHTSSFPLSRVTQLQEMQPLLWLLHSYASILRDLQMLDDDFY